jgi:hypothetical protein
MLTQVPAAIAHNGLRRLNTTKTAVARLIAGRMSPSRH